MNTIKSKLKKCVACGFLVTVFIFIISGNASAYYNLEIGSPCIDAGDPTSDYLLEPGPNGSRINMGAYGGTHAATLSDLLLIGDLNGDGVVDLTDTILALQVIAGMNPIAVEENFNPGNDVNGDGKIGMEEVLYSLKQIVLE